MSRSDWFRRTTWTDKDAYEFHSRLQRSRGRAQYLCIQASTLLETHAPELVAPALELIQDMLAKYPDPFFLARAHLTRAKCLLALDRLPDAIEAFRESFAAQRVMPNNHVNAYLEFAWTVGRLRLSNYFAEALAAIKEFWTPEDMEFPAGVYTYFGALAFISEGLGDAAGAARWAQDALKAAAATSSPFPRHRKVGLVRAADNEVTTRLQYLAGGFQHH